MKKSMRSYASSRLRLAVILGWLVGSLTITGCDNPANTVINDTSTTKNKRTARVEKVKGGKADSSVKKEGP